MNAFPEERATGAARVAVSAAAVDVLAVLVFALLGRRSHAEGLDVAGVAGTAAPFLVGLAAGWVAGRVWRSPTALPSGLWAVGGAVVGGLALRAAITGRLPVTFVLVTTVTLLVLLLGWRLLVHATRRVRS